ncbi:MAG: exodeoxyribonuclease III, partial [Candidatus ainarchaeum sp.]|nr:exodeoxyribonuclease III [Candidatus ainarchaeum sp.]
MKIISWNVNGVRAILKKDFLVFMENMKSDIYCLQETKIHNSMLSDEIKNIGVFDNYKSYWNGAERKGYSGTGIISKIIPLSIKNGFNSKLFDH